MDKDKDKELEVLHRILRKVQSPMWWARLSYPDADWWSDEEKQVLATNNPTKRKKGNDSKS